MVEEENKYDPVAQPQEDAYMSLMGQMESL